MLKYRYVPFTIGKQVPEIIILTICSTLADIIFSVYYVFDILGSFYQRYNGTRATGDDHSLTKD
jgi:hypothetical protein